METNNDSKPKTRGHPVPYVCPRCRWTFARRKKCRCPACGIILVIGSDKPHPSTCKEEYYSYGRWYSDEGWWTGWRHFREAGDYEKHLQEVFHRMDLREEEHKEQQQFLTYRPTRLQ